MKNTPVSPDDDLKALSLADDIKKAIDLRYMFYQRDLDKEFEKDGGTILYAVDSNILNAHFQLERTTPLKYLTIAQVFHGPLDNKFAHTDSLLSNVIISYLIRSLDTPNLRNSTPLLLLPGHDDEARRLYDNIITGWEERDHKRNNAKRTLLSFLGEFERRKTEEERFDLTTNFEAQLYDLLYKIQEPFERIQEFNKLLAERRLLTFTRAALNPELQRFTHPDSRESVFVDFSPPSAADRRDGSEGWWDENMAEAASPDSQPNGTVRSGSQDWWDKELYDKVPEKFRTPDSQALSTLYSLNRALMPAKVRVILLTLGEDIIDLGDQFRPFRHSDSELAQYSFSDLYIRYPRAFLSEPQIMTLSADQLQQADLTVWLDAFLADVNVTSHQSMVNFSDDVKPIAKDSEKLLEIARAALDRRPDIHREIFEKWQCYVNDILTAHAAPSEEARKALARILGKSHGARVDVLREFEHYMKDVTERSWDDFFFTAAKTGVDFIGKFESRVRRNVPFLYLGDLGPTGGLSDLVQRINGVIKSADEVRRHLDELNAIDRATYDPSGCINSICYAALFAHAGRWSVANQIAMRAEAIARRDRLAAAGSGAVDRTASAVEREANYMCSVTRRLTATAAADLDACDRHVAAAIEALRRNETGAHSASPDTDVSSYPPLTGIRFEAERIAISAARVLFLCRQSRWQLAGPKRAELSGEIVQRSNEIMSSVRSALSVVESCLDDTICRASKISLRRNFFNSVFLLEVADALTDDVKQEIAEMAPPHLEDLKNVYGEGCAQHMSIMDIYFTLYAASFNPGLDDPILSEVQQAQDEIAKSSNRGADSFVMPYDATRFRLMAQYTNQH